MQGVPVRARLHIAVVAALAIAVAGALVATGVASPLAKSRKPVKVKVKDDFFKPTDVKVKKNGKVTWSWGKGTFDPHNVTLKKGPHGVKKSKFTSQTSSAPHFKYTKKFKKSGKYKFYCTIHPDIMKMKVVVKR